MKRIPRPLSFQTVIIKLLIKSDRLQKSAYRIKKENKKEDRNGGKARQGLCCLLYLYVCVKTGLIHPKIIKTTHCIVFMNVYKKESVSESDENLILRNSVLIT